MFNTLTDINFDAPTDFGPSALTKALQAAQKHFAGPDDHLIVEGDYYCFRARYDGIWFGILIGMTEPEVRNRIKLVQAMLPGASFEFGYNYEVHNTQTGEKYHLEDILEV